MGFTMETMLDSTKHARILADFEKVCATAGLQGRFMHQSMTVYCASLEVDWVRHFHKHRAEGVPGLVLDGVDRPDTKCQAICAALLRNYIDARVIPLNSLLEFHEAGIAPNPSVLLVPNFYLTSLGKSLPAWKVQMVYDLLLQRASQNKPTVLYVENLAGLRAAYGQPIADFLDSYKISSK